MYKFYLTISSSRIEVHPLNFNNTTLIDEQEKDQIYYRRKFNGTLQFIGDDFELLHITELAYPCQNILFEIEQKDSGADTYHYYWDGLFSTVDGKFDLDRCTFDVTPHPNDNYVQFDEHADEQWDISGQTAVTTHTTTHTYDRNRWLMDVVRFLADKIIDGITVQSNFFELDTNYITDTDNVYQHLTIAQKSDIKRPTSSNPATNVVLSWNELMSMLKMFNVWWKYDGTTLYLEHYDYFTNSAGMDLRTQKMTEKTNKYSYLKEEMPKYEQYLFMEAGNINFEKGIIKYDSTCTNKDPESNTTEYAFPVTTDLDFIVQSVADATLNGSNISDEGWVILANYLDGASYYVYYGTAFDSVDANYNVVLSWSYLLRMLFLHNRVLPEGFINGSPYDFISVRKNKLQELNAKVCYSDNFDPEDYILTELGMTWFSGEKAKVKTAALKPSGEMRFELLYGPDKDEEVVLPDRPKSIHIIVEESNISTYFSEPNPYTTFYWVWLNDVYCQEIEIAAGVMIDSRGLAQSPTTIAFNINDTSTIGWQFIYNDNEGMVMADPDDCGAIPPTPPVPAAPVISIAQASNCAPVVVSWAAVPDATYYKIYRFPDKYLNMSFGLVKTMVGGTSWNDTQAGNINGQLFHYRATAGNVAGESGNSNLESITTACV